MPLWVTRCRFTAIRTRGFMPSAAMFGAGTPMAGTVTGIGKSGIMAEGMTAGMGTTVATADKRQFPLHWPTFASRGSLPHGYCFCGNSVGGRPCGRMIAVAPANFRERGLPPTGIYELQLFVG